MTRNEGRPHTVAQARGERERGRGRERARGGERGRESERVRE